MENELSLTAFLETLGCRLRLGYYWSAKSADESRIVFTIWSDQLHDERYEFWPSTEPLPDWTKLPGAYEWRKHLELARTGAVEILGVLCHAVDPDASPRKRHYYDETSLLVFNLVEDGSGIWGEVIGEVDVEVARGGKIGYQVVARQSALSDILDAAPRGVEFPLRIEAVGTSFRRDQMVRNYVLRRASGRCEYCGTEGFMMPNGMHYLEAHHVIALSCEGQDTVQNVVALCASHHREAHFGARAEELNAELLTLIEQIEFGAGSNKP